MLQGHNTHTQVSVRSKYLVFPTSAAPTYHNMHCKKSTSENIDICPQLERKELTREKLRFHEGKD